MDTFEKVKEIIVQYLDVKEDIINMHTNFEVDLDMDSLDIVEMIMLFENKFSNEVEDDMIVNIKTVRDVVKYFE